MGRGAENLKKAKSWQEKARKKKVILGILAVVLVLILLLVILSEFGAFSGGGGDGETTIIEKNIYITKLSDGTEIESEEPPKDWKSNGLVPLTTTTTIAPSASDVAEGSEDYIEWEEEYED